MLISSLFPLSLPLFVFSFSIWFGIVCRNADTHSAGRGVLVFSHRPPLSPPQICIYILFLFLLPVSSLRPPPPSLLIYHLQGIGKVVDAWDYTPPYTATVILTLSELLCMAVFFIVLRVSVIRRLGKWAEVPEELVSRRTFTDNGILLSPLLLSSCFLF